MKQRHIFYDDSQKRWPFIKRIALILGVIFGLIGSIFLVSLIFIPSKGPALNISAPVHRTLRSIIPKIPVRKKQMQKYILNRIRREVNSLLIEDKQKNIKSKNIKSKGEKVVAAFYTVWQEPGIHSLKAHADKLTQLIPEWLHLSKDGENLDLYDWNPKILFHNKEVVEIARKNNLVIMPMINNAQGSEFDLKRVKFLLTNKIKQKKFVNNLKNWLLENHFQGINIDFEKLDDETNALMPDFFSWMVYRTSEEIS
ncbi:MAG: hypothetical protein NT145_03280 [Elusimicrobia bacterium]|nr:hypothetical protein [Elusimicrobiota bacterium]